jgi:hypothetical protein
MCKRNCIICFWNSKNLVKYTGKENLQKELENLTFHCRCDVICKNFVLDADYSDLIREFMVNKKIDSLGTYQLTEVPNSSQS